MESAPRNRTPNQVEARFRQVLAEGDMEQPDEVEFDPAANELIFFWHEPKLAVVLELDSNAPLDVFSMASVQPPI